MTYDNFTLKAQEAILKAQNIAGGYDQQNVDTTHLMKGIIEIDEDLTKFLLQKMGVNISLLKEKLIKAIKSYPRVEGAQKQYLTKDANLALSRAKKLLPEFGDEFISLELIILGIVQGKDKASNILHSYF